MTTASRCLFAWPRWLSVFPPRFPAQENRCAPRQLLFVLLSIPGLTLTLLFASLIANDAYADKTKPSKAERKFVQKMVKIARHGDLSDYRFVEKTLAMPLKEFNGERNRIYTPLKAVPRSLQKNLTYFVDKADADRSYLVFATNPEYSCMTLNGVHKIRPNASRSETWTEPANGGSKEFVLETFLHPQRSVRMELEFYAFPNVSRCVLYVTLHQFTSKK
jgi:ribosomal protein L17